MPEESCGCGRPAKHRGFCSYQRANRPNWSAVKKKPPTLPWNPTAVLLEGGKFQVYPHPSLAPEGALAKFSSEDDLKGSLSILEMDNLRCQIVEGAVGNSGSPDLAASRLWLALMAGVKKPPEKVNVPLGIRPRFTRPVVELLRTKVLRGLDDSLNKEISKLPFPMNLTAAAIVQNRIVVVDDEDGFLLVAEALSRSPLLAPNILGWGSRSCDASTAWDELVQGLLAKGWAEEVSYLDYAREVAEFRKLPMFLGKV